MKKMKTMRAAALLLALTLITSCFVGGTFAKYTTSASGTDTARVAYWGFTSSGTNLDLNLFKDSETNVQTSKTGEHIVAPGTTGTATFSFVTANDATNKPEVAYEFVVDATGTCGDGLKAELVFKLDDKQVGSTGSFDELLTAIEALAGEGATDGKKTYQPGELPTAFSNGSTHTISWEWVFDGEDTADTALGNDAFDQLEEVTLNISVTATQVN